MAQYDGSIRINTQLNTRGFERGAKGLLSGIERLGNSIRGMIGSLGFAIGIAGLVSFGKKAIETASDIQEVQNVVDTAFGNMSYKMEEFAKTSVKQFGISQLSAKQLGSTFMAMGKSMVGDMETASNMALNLTARAADMASFYNKSVQETSTALKSIYTGETESLKEYGVVMTQVNLQEFAYRQGINKKISAMNQAEKVQLQYAYVMEQTALAAGDFAKTSGSWANQVRILSEQFKELLSIIGSGLVKVLTPVVQFLNTVLTQLIAITKQAGSLLTKVFGLSMPVSDSKKFATDMEIAAGGAEELAEGVEEAGKEAKKALAPFDDLNVLAKETGGGGAADGAGIGGGFEMPELELKDTEVEEVDALSGAIDGLIEKLKPLFDWFVRLKDLFAKGFLNGLGESWNEQILDIQESAKNIVKNLAEIFTDPGVTTAAQTMVENVVYAMGESLGAVASIGITIGQNLIGGVDIYLEENKDFLKEKLISIFDIAGDVALLIGEAFGSIAYVFEAFRSENGQQLTANLIGLFTDAVMGTLETAGKLAEDILKVFIKPFTENKEEFRTALEGFLGVLSEVAGTVKEGVDDTFAKIEEVYDEHFKPFFDSVSEGLSDLVGKFLEFWNEKVQPILDEWAELFDELWKEHLQPVLDELIELFGTVADSLKSLWEEMLMPVIDWVIQYVMPILAKVIDFMVKDFFRIFGVVSDIIGGIIKVIGGIITFLTGTFTGDWEKTWDGIVQIFEGIWDAIKSVINSLLGGIEKMANGVVDGINFVIRALNNLSFDLPSWLPGDLGGKSLGFNLSELPPVTIPRLATGAVIRGGNPFMAILGDQPAGKTNIEAPLDTIKQAVREELAGIDFGSARSGQAKVVLNINGVDLGEAMLDDLFSVMSRRGYDVSVLGVT